MVLEININGDHHARKQQKRMKSYTVTTKRQEDGNRAYSQSTNGNLFCHIIFQTSLGRSQTIISIYKKTRVTMTQEIHPRS